MSTGSELRQRLARIARALGPAVDRVALVGGCAAAAHDIPDVAGDVRRAEDVDLLVDVDRRAPIDACPVVP